jgi:hypothetical protein
MAIQPSATVMKIHSFPFHPHRAEVPQILELASLTVLYLAMTHI